MLGYGLEDKLRTPSQTGSGMPRTIKTGKSTVLIFTATNSLTDRMTILYRGNQSEKIEIKCQEPKEKRNVVISSGNTLDVPYYCGVVSKLINISKIALHSYSKGNYHS